MIDYYLKFSDQTEAQSVLYQNNQPLYRNTDVIGIISDIDMTDPDNPIITPQPGWHVNVRVVDEDGTSLEPFQVFPLTPRRVWS